MHRSLFYINKFNKYKYNLVYQTRLLCNKSTSDEIKQFDDKPKNVVNIKNIEDINKHVNNINENLDILFKNCVDLQKGIEYCEKENDRTFVSLWLFIMAVGLITSGRH